MASSGATGRQRPPLSEARRARVREARRGPSGRRAARGRHARGARNGLDRRASAARDRRARPARPALRGDLAGDRARRARPSASRSSTLDELGELDIAIDGADQIDQQGWLVKGGGGAHTREKIVASAARALRRDRLRREGRHEPLARRCRSSCCASASDTRCTRSRRRACAGVAASPDGGLIADYLGPIGDPRALAARLSATPGVVGHGLFAPELVSLVLIAGSDGVESRAGAKR